MAEPEEGLAGGNYEVIKKRLVEQATALGARIDALNESRKRVFGGTELVVSANERVRTENNCVPRDIVNVRGKLLFGYNVFIGMKETAVSAVFSVHQFAEQAGGYDVSELPRDAFDTAFLSEPEFVKHFTELYRYYKDTRLLQLRKTETRLLAIFQVGASVSEIRVFRWKIHPDGTLAYIDSRGEPDHVLPPPHDFEWRATTRDDQVKGRFPHLSILDEVFVETTGGDLTIKIENNTETGEGIYAEPVTDPNQSIDDGEFHYAKLGGLVLLKIKPFRETAYRYFVFNGRTKSVVRIDAIGNACRRLPEDHGIIFPGGYLLETGGHKIFESNVAGLVIERIIQSPNGEDALYVFHRADEGLYLLLPYNLIRKEAQAPIQCHGYCLFDDGKMVVFRALSAEPTRVHPMQIWQTPFTSAEYAAQKPTDGSFLAKVGNAELVRGISELYSIRQLAQASDPTRRTYDELIELTGQVADGYYWLDHDEVSIEPVLVEIKRTAELIVDEFEKVLALRKRAAEELDEAKAAQAELVRRVQTSERKSIDAYMQLLTALRHQRGHLISSREVRYMDLAAVEALEKDVIEHFDRVSRETVQFLLGPDALAPVRAQLDELLASTPSQSKVAELKPLLARLDEVNEGLAVVSEVVSTLEVDDATARTQILEALSDVLAQLNRTRATMEARKRELASSEGRAEFAAQFNLLGQSVASGLTIADTPEKCDEQLSRLMVQLEELEARFSELDEFTADLAKKREEVYEAFSGKKQSLLDARQRRAENLLQAATRILEGVVRRSRTFKDQDDLNAYFASDAMILKLRQIVEQLRALDDHVKADEIEARLLASRQDALRSLRDKIELFVEGEDLIQLGKHRFTVNTQPLELTMVPRDDRMALHLTGTGFYETIADAEFEETHELWSQELVSETASVYRAEYLAASLFFDAERETNGLSFAILHEAMRAPNGLLDHTRKVMTERYDEGYERGVHDADAVAILEKLLALRESAGLLRFGPTPRAYASLFWVELDADSRQRLELRGRNLGRLAVAFGVSAELARFGAELADRIHTLLSSRAVPLTSNEARIAGKYLAEELALARPGEPLRISTGGDATTLKGELFARLEVDGTRHSFEEDLRVLGDDLISRLALVRAWLEALLEKSERREALGGLRHAVLEAAAIVLTEGKVDRAVSRALTRATVEGLLGQHPRIRSQRLELELDEFLARLGAHFDERVPAYKAYRALRHRITERERERLRLDEFKPKVMSSFVRNRLINDVYLPLVGDNLAKQLGAAGEGKRTDLMGLLLLVSPPGYGKTTLMEYVANRLGLVFVKVNGPALGHEVTSIDPGDAPNATARQEVEKINLAFEMGQNVMLYLDDIQHTSSELLQKFISLCDAQRRVEGVWKGKTRTYDLRGKKFCVVMAGNPYTESGEKFQIPDMLANRADTYNLGDILEGRDDVFAMSYLENALTSNPALKPLATRDPNDVYKILRMAGGEPVPATELSYGYSPAELGEMIAVFARLAKIRDVLLKVNLEYIRSASQSDAFRTEPPFKLQGSYRNMNKLAEKVVAAMNDRELDALVRDHYGQESQTLTTGAEQNLLKLGELRGSLDDTERARWEAIKAEFRRQKAMGGADDDPVTRVTGSLGLLGRELEAIRTAVTAAVERSASVELERIDADRSRVEAERVRAEHAGDSNGSAMVELIARQLDRLQKALEQLGKPQLEVTLQAPPPPDVSALVNEQFAVIEQRLLPLVSRANQDLADSKAMHEHIMQLLELIRSVDARLRSA
jgi:hypothetical protein